MRKWLWSISALLLFAISFYIAPVQAMSVKPAIIEAEIQPTKPLVGTLWIKNDEEIAKTFYFSIQKFVPDGTEGRQKFLPPTDLKGLPEWVSIEAPSVQLQPGQSKEIKYAIQAPSDAEPGGHYAALFVSDQPSLSGASNVAMGARTGILLLITIPGNQVKQARIASFQAQTTHGELPVLLSVDIDNQGNTHFQPQGEWTIRDIFQREVAMIPLNSAESRVLPSSTRQFTAEWNQEQSREPSRGFIKELQQEWSPFLLGKYTAEIDLQQPSSTSNGQLRVSFFIWPWRTLALLGAIMIVCAGGMMMTRRRV